MLKLFVELQLHRKVMTSGCWKAYLYSNPTVVLVNFGCYIFTKRLCAAKKSSGKLEGEFDIIAASSPLPCFNVVQMLGLVACAPVNLSTPAPSGKSVN